MYHSVTDHSSDYYESEKVFAIFISNITMQEIIKSIRSNKPYSSLNISRGSGSS